MVILPALWTLTLPLRVMFKIYKKFPGVRGGVGRLLFLWGKGFPKGEGLAVFLLIHFSPSALMGTLGFDLRFLSQL